MLSVPKASSVETLGNILGDTLGFSRQHGASSTFIAADGIKIKLVSEKADHAYMKSIIVAHSHEAVLESTPSVTEPEETSYFGSLFGMFDQSVKKMWSPKLLINQTKPASESRDSPTSPGVSATGPLCVSGVAEVVGGFSFEEFSEMNSLVRRKVQDNAK